MIVAISVVAIAGTVVTASGPHGGDAHVKRFSFLIPQVAEVHGTTVVVFLGLLLVTFALLRRTRAPVEDQRRLALVLILACVQAAIGYIQYFNGIPALLVGVHIAGATAVFAAVLHFYVHLSERDPVPTDRPPPVEPVLAPA